MESSCVAHFPLMAMWEQPEEMQRLPLPEPSRLQPSPEVQEPSPLKCLRVAKLPRAQLAPGRQPEQMGRCRSLLLELMELRRSPPPERIVQPRLLRLEQT